MDGFWWGFAVGVVALWFMEGAAAVVGKMLRISTDEREEPPLFPPGVKKS